MLDKAIEHGKEHRRPYRKSKRFDTTCRNHGGQPGGGNQCPWCRDDFLHSSKVREEAAEEAMKEGLDEAQTD